MKRLLPALAAILWMLTSNQAHAGMTVVTLTDLAKSRLDALSFFLALYLLICLVVKWIWNQLAKSFPIMPALSYRRALALVFLSGLLFYVVLTMISGARELLTPGAWEKQGTGYRTRESGSDPGSKEGRKAAMIKLRDAIWDYAASHDGKAPAGPFTGELPYPQWKFSGGGIYCLMPGVKPGVGRDILLYEPSTAGARRYVLLTDGTVEDRAEGTLKSEIEAQLKR